MNLVNALADHLSVPVIPRFELPSMVSRLGQCLPQWPHGLLLVTALNAALRLKLLPLEELAAHFEGKRFRIFVKDTGGQADFSFIDGRFVTIFSPGSREPDLSFSGNLSTYLQLITRQEDPDTLFFKRDLEIMGDTELGLTTKNMLDSIDLKGFFGKNRTKQFP